MSSEVEAPVWLHHVIWAIRHRADCHSTFEWARNRCDSPSHTGNWMWKTRWEEINDYISNGTQYGGGGGPETGSQYIHESLTPSAECYPQSYRPQRLIIFLVLVWLQSRTHGMYLLGIQRDRVGNRISGNHHGLLLSGETKKIFEWKTKKPKISLTWAKSRANHVNYCCIKEKLMLTCT